VLFQEARRFEPSALPPVAHARSPFACPTRSSRASRCTAPRPDEIRRARREICARVGARASDYGWLQAFVVKKKATRFLHSSTEHWSGKKIKCYLHRDAVREKAKNKN